MRTPDQEIRELLKSPKRREEAFRKIVRSTSRSLYMTIKGITRDHMLTDDVLQETYLTAFEKIEQFNWRSSLLTWLEIIARRKAFRLMDKEARYVDMDVELSIESDHRPEPKQWLSVLESAIEALPVRQKEVFQMRYYEGLSFKEIGKRLSLSEGSLKASYHLAKEKIKTDFRKKGLIG